VEAAELVWPQLTEVRPAQIAPGGTVKVIASGGFLRCGPSGYIESARQFQLYLDGKQVGILTCYINHCEQEFNLTADIPLGTHVISVEGGSEISLQVTGN